MISFSSWHRLQGHPTLRPGGIISYKASPSPCSYLWIPVHMLLSVPVLTPLVTSSGGWHQIDGMSPKW